MKSLTIITHNSRFHADDVFAVATLALVLEKSGTSFKVVRTRDENIVPTGDFVLDIGGIYDAEKNRFDHHQKGGAGARNNAIPYASFGLVWRKYGEELSGSRAGAERIDQRVVQSIDAMDNGLDILAPARENLLPLIIQDIVFAFVPTWKEGPDNLDAHFLYLVEFAKNFLKREIVQIEDFLEAEQIIEKVYQEAEDKRVLLIEKNYPWDFIVLKYPETLFVIYPTQGSDTWKVGTVRKDEKTYATRKSFPESWAGKRDSDLAKVTGVPDSVFCHNARFLAVAKSRAGAIELAKKALLA